MIALLLLLGSILCWALAAFCNSIMDTITHHWWNCIFHDDKYNESFWNPDSKKLPYIIPHTKYKVNAWHLFKSAMIVLFSISNICMYILGTITHKILNEWISAGVLLVMYGVLWNFPFNLFYNKILLKKQK